MKYGVGRLQVHSQVLLRVFINTFKPNIQKLEQISISHAHPIIISRTQIASSITVGDIPYIRTMSVYTDIVRIYGHFQNFKIVFFEIFSKIRNDSAVSYTHLTLPTKRIV